MTSQALNSHDRIAAVFAADGALAESLQGFAPRAPQTQMALAVAKAIENDQSLIVEAGTGTGKTLGYLVPALLSGKRTVVSTGTKALQDQLFDRDLPAAHQALAATIAGGYRIARLKGRANYLCLQRFEESRGSAALSPLMTSQLETVRAWSGETRTGDVAELAALPEGSPLWPMITSTTDNCLGSKCPKYDDCWVVEARRQAQEADLVVVNHHLLFADLALKEQGFGEVLPGADTVILDEAHQVPETAAVFFGVNITARQLRGLTADCHSELGAVGNDDPELGEKLVQFDVATSALLRNLPTGGRQSWDAAMRAAGIELTALVDALTAVSSHLNAVAQRSDGFASLAERAKALGERIAELQQDNVEQVRWAERFREGFTLRSTPLSVAPQMTAARARLPSSWILTSATLAVGGTDFSHFQQRLGMEDAATHRFDSPFNYARNSRLLLPDLPDPNERGYRQALATLAGQLLDASQGGAFVLCTSIAAVRELGGLLDDVFDGQVLMQGDAPKHMLLEAFRLDGDAVLVGTQSFWEGVDVPGRALRLVMIDRLPFASPADPVLQARSAALKAQGRNPFSEDQLPSAVVTLKQGAGRLIRGPADRGVLVICDPRVRSKYYGRLFLKSLPPMTQTTDVADACRFLHQMNTESAT